MKARRRPKAREVARERRDRRPGEPYVTQRGASISIGTAWMTASQSASNAPHRLQPKTRAASRPRNPQSPSFVAFTRLQPDVRNKRRAGRQGFSNLFEAANARRSGTTMRRPSTSSTRLRAASPIGEPLTQDRHDGKGGRIDHVGLQGAEPQRTVEERSKRTKHADERRRQAQLATQRMQTTNRIKNSRKSPRNSKIQHNEYYVE